MLFLGSHAGAGLASSPNHSPPVNLREMTNGGGGFGLAPSRGAERGPRSPSGRVVPVRGRWGAMLGSPRAMARAGGGGFGDLWVPPGGSAQREELQAPVRLGAGMLLLQGWRFSTLGMVEQPWGWGACCGSPAWPWVPGMGHRGLSGSTAMP